MALPANAWPKCPKLTARASWFKLPTACEWTGPQTDNLYSALGAGLTRQLGQLCIRLRHKKGKLPWTKKGLWLS